MTVATAAERMKAAMAELRKPPASPFEVEDASITRRTFDAINARARAARRALVKPQNAARLVGEIAGLEAGDRLHAITPGHYVFGDLLTQLVDRLRPDELHVVTLSLSIANVDAVAGLLDGCKVGRVAFMVSNYFASTNKEIHAHLIARAAERAERWKVAVTRTHAKIAMVSPRLVIETSANLRSSQNIEQITALADAELYAFHRAWMDPLFAREAAP